MGTKRPFVTKEQAEAIASEYPTPFYLYDEAGIRARAKALAAAFSWNLGFREYFAVKATPNPAILSILHEEGCGCDCATGTELMLAEACGVRAVRIMFSSNDTPDEIRRLPPARCHHQPRLLPTWSTAFSRAWVAACPRP